MFITQTKSWIKQFVIAHNLCPFAGQPFAEELIKYVLIESEDIEVLVETTFLECIALKNISPSEIETTLIIHPNLLNDFDAYLGLVEQLQEDLHKLELEGIVQIASFHPEYQFDGTQLNDAENFTNRSPYPMIHILRENSVEKAINLHPNAEAIPSKNIETMNRLGRAELIRMRNEIIRTN